MKVRSVEDGEADRSVLEIAGELQHLEIVQQIIVYILIWEGGSDPVLSPQTSATLTSTYR